MRTRALGPGNPLPGPARRQGRWRILEERPRIKTSQYQKNTRTRNPQDAKVTLFFRMTRVCRLDEGIVITWG
jgi:hypothetical protein